MRVSVGRVITQTPAMLFSLWVWLLTGVLAPAYVSVPVTVVWAGLAAASLTRGGQTALTRLLLSARPPTMVEQTTLADPITRMRHSGPNTHRLDVRVVETPGVAAIGSGRHTVIITRDAIRAAQTGRVSSHQLTALLVSAAGQIDRGTTRGQWLLTVLTLPWLPFRIVLHAFDIVFGRSLPVRFLLKVRGLYGVAALIQTTLEGRPLIGVGALIVVATTYWQPYLASQVTRHQTLLGDQYAAEHGHGPALAALLGRLRPDTDGLERIHHLTHPRDAPPGSQDEPGSGRSPDSSGTASAGGRIRPAASNSWANPSRLPRPSVSPATAPANSGDSVEPGSPTIRHAASAFTATPSTSSHTARASRVTLSRPSNPRAAWLIHR